ncbi:outer membrane protein assembly factor BamE [Candidatus Thioglobus sp.]|jgi:outer membrane protein assembly factor BamE|nr:outer membrane protein assembly factor BamE [Candidatus Thioglobus sp.]MDB9951683.1 outer membrane protein assembly factor BamE [Candidatus Thioglobus sp.]MDC1290692.1 outer membrane protein assembly factor BamE [Candidatus Thioglobus sp.]|tara:strand:+ start:467 stop:913 length:447 start_codon:yes stop_codon:yes gene_type:complete
MMKRLTFILLGCLILTGCSNSLPKAAELPKLPKFTMPDLPKMPKLSLPSWAKPKMPSIDVYKPTILQGVILDIKEVNQLQLGMSKQSVMNLIGSPSIIDPFHQYQWDYINHSTIDGEIEIRYRLRLIFSGNLLSEIDKSGLEELLNSN